MKTFIAITLAIYTITGMIAISKVNTELKDIVENRFVGATSLKVTPTTSQSELEVKPTKLVKGLQVTADQWTTQKALNHNGHKLVQQSQRNMHAKYQWTRNNYQQPVQKSAQMYQFDLLTAEFTGDVR